MELTKKNNITVGYLENIRAEKKKDIKIDESIDDDLGFSISSAQKSKDISLEKTRLGVGRVGEIKLIDPKIGHRKKQKIIKRLKKIPIWYSLVALFVLFGLARLIFMKGGIIDFKEMESNLNYKMHQINLIKAENSQLENELRRIQNDRRYQKNLIREHLGVISDDEYLILFAKEKDGSSN